MATTIKLCKDIDGYLWATALPEDVDDCESGPIIGPPEGMKKSVHNRLAEAGIYNAFDLLNNRPALVGILRDLGEDLRYAQHVTHIYQKQYFLEQEDE